MHITSAGPPVSLQELADLEREVGPLPESLRQFLLTFNGGRPERKRFAVPSHPEQSFDLKLLFGLTRPVETSNIGWEVRELPGCYGPGRIAFGSTDTGDRVVLDVKDGSVWFWDSMAPTPEAAFHPVASSHARFLDGLYGAD